LVSLSQQNKLTNSSLAFLVLYLSLHYSSIGGSKSLRSARVCLNPHERKKNMGEVCAGGTSELQAAPEEGLDVSHNTRDLSR
jgi:hypothetical protein